MRQWVSRSDYTVVAYRGMLPRRVILTSEGIEIPPPRPNAQSVFPTAKQAGGLVPASELIEELQQTKQNYQRDFLPASAVIGIVKHATQFTLQNRVDAVPANVKQWSDPPHVELANCAVDSPEDVKRFIETYGFSLSMVADPGLRVPAPKAISVTVERIQQDQEFLRRSWGMTGQAQPLKDAFLWSPDDINFVKGKPQIILSDIWEYILALFLIDLSAGRLKVCANPGCKALKYFVKERRNQKFCSVPCKNSFHVSLWLANPENRKAWNADRRKARPKAKAPGGRKS